MTETPCICTFCNSDKNREAWPVTDIFGCTRSIMICADCSSWFLWPRPGKEEHKEAYDNTYYGLSETKFRWKVFEKALDRFRMQRAHRMFRLLKPGSKVLDVGCGNGRYLMYLSQLGKFELHGVELPGRSAQRAAEIKEIKLFTGSFEDATYEDGYFDSISLYHVFEHLEQPAASLEKIDRILNMNGIIIFSFPNIRSFQGNLFKGAWLHLDPPRHLFLPDPKHFENTMKKMGYSLIRKKYFSIEQNPIGMVQGLLNLMCRRRDVLFERMKDNHNYAPEYGRFNLVLQNLFLFWAMPHFIISDIFESAFKSGATIEMTFRKNPK